MRRREKKKKMNVNLIFITAESWFDAQISLIYNSDNNEYTDILQRTNGLCSTMSA